MAQSINFTVMHGLTQSMAFGRVVRYLSSQNNPNVTPLKTDIDNQAFTIAAKIKLTVLGHEETHTLTFAVQPGQVHVTSDVADSMIEAAEMLVEQGRIQSQLIEALKP